jgi:hypothetical protein
MTTACALFHRCRKAGIALAPDGDGITFDAPSNVQVPVDEIRQVKPEMLAVLRGNYLEAAAALVSRLPDPRPRQVLASLFDERVRTLRQGGTMSGGEALRQAYVELARTVERDDEVSPDRALSVPGNLSALQEQN